MMKYRFFTIPVWDADEPTTELNTFLESVRTATVDKQFVEDGRHSFWSVCVSYVESGMVNK